MRHNLPDDDPFCIAVDVHIDAIESPILSSSEMCTNIERLSVVHDGVPRAVPIGGVFAYSRDEVKPARVPQIRSQAR